MNSIRLKARAKINLGLDVLGKRENGYHDVRMVMQTVGIYDRLIMTKITDESDKSDKGYKGNAGDEVRIKTNVGFLPVNENNLIYKAIMLMKTTFGLKGVIEVDLNKFIPVAAGMAGGSSDAACALFGMNRLYNLNLSLAELQKLGVQIGADVPYCLLRGTALAEGIGEILTPLPSVPDCNILIAKPPINVSTKIVYENLDISKDLKHPDIDGLIEAIRLKDIKLMASRMGNVLESVTIPMYPVIDSIKQDMIANGALNAMMSGSGPTVFGIFPDEESCVRCQAFLKKKGEAKQVYTTNIFSVR